MENKNKPITPTKETKYYDSEKYYEEHLGLTKREYFAGLAMQGLISSCDWNVTRFNNDVVIATCENALKLADEILKQLEK